MNASSWTGLMIANHVSCRADAGDVGVEEAEEGNRPKAVDAVVRLIVVAADAAIAQEDEVVAAMGVAMVVGEALVEGLGELQHSVVQRVDLALIFLFSILFFALVSLRPYGPPPRYYDWYYPYYWSGYA